MESIQMNHKIKTPTSKKVSQTSSTLSLLMDICCYLDRKLKLTVSRMIS